MSADVFDSALKATRRGRSTRHRAERPSRSPAADHFADGFHIVIQKRVLGLGFQLEKLGEILAASLQPLPGRVERSTPVAPAGTYARRVLEQLLIDLSWYSSRLEGNGKSLLDTRELFLKGRSPGDDTDATMLLNHKDAIEFIVDAVPTYGITMPVVCNVQSTLMNGCLPIPPHSGRFAGRL